jgi:alpha-tubulin suppressor-like RCC1 family protein
LFIGDEVFTTPTEIKIQNHKFTMITAGTNYLVLLTQDGQTFAYGENSNGQLADGTRISRNAPVRTIVPAPVLYIKSSFIAVEYEGTSFVSQYNITVYGSLGDNSSRAFVDGFQMRHTDIDGQITAFSNTRRYTMMLTDTGKVYSVGSNTKGQIGDGTLVLRLLIQ